MTRDRGKVAVGLAAALWVGLCGTAPGFSQEQAASWPEASSQEPATIVPIDLDTPTPTAVDEGLSGLGEPTSASPDVGPTIDQAGPYQYIVPTSGHMAGSAGTFWMTDMVVHNPGPSSATVNIYFLKEKQSNAAALGTTFPVSPNRSFKLKDIIEDTFHESAAAGALLIGSTAPVLVASRTFNDQPSGTYGQYVPGQGASRLVTGTTEARLVQLTKNASYRTNIGFANVTAASTPVLVTLYRSDGSLAGALAEVVDPWGYKQINDVFAKAGAGTADDAYAIVSSSLAGARYHTYASVIDSRTGDPITVIPVAAASAASAAPGDVQGPTADQIVPVFSDDFEGTSSWLLRYVNGSTNHKVNWGRSSHRKADGNYSWWCVGSGSGSPAPGGNYPPNMGAWMEYGPFSLANATSASLELDLWLEAQTSVDKFQVWTSTAYNGTYSSLSLGSANTNGAWVHKTFSLSSRAGAPEVWLVITFTSDASIEYEGAYIDNLVIKKTVACTAPQAPVLTAPAAATGGTSYAVTWTVTSWEDKYQIQEADNPAFTNPTTTTLSGTSKSFTHAVAAPTTYYYRVAAQACSPNVQQSSWSNVGQTVVSPACTTPAAPAVSAPATATGGVSYSVTWSATSPENHYLIQEADNSAFTSPTVLVVTGTSQSFVHSVATATTYYYRVSAYACNPALFSGYSAAAFTVVSPACATPAAPTVAAPATATSGVSYAVTWSATSPENRYQVQEANNSAFTGATTTSVTGTSISFAHTATAATTYYVRVAAQACSPTLQSAWSSTGQTVVSPACSAPAAPALTAPATATSGASYTVSWTASSPEGTYEVEEATASSFAGATRHTVSGTSRAFSHTVAAATTYYYRARATVSCGGGLASQWSGTGQTQVAASVPPTSAEVYVPGAAAVSGTGGTNWRTDLEIHNPGLTSATYTIALLLRDQDNPSPLERPFSLEPGKSVRYGNALQTIFQTSGAATLRVTPAAGQVVVTSRTYDDQTTGTYGQFVAGRPASQATAYGASARLILVSQSLDPTSGFRTNVGLVNVTALTITVEVTAYLANGSLIGTRSWLLGPYKSIQRNEIFTKDFAAGEVNDGFLVVRTTTPGGKLLAYASVIDNRSNDPIYVPAEVAQ